MIDRDSTGFQLKTMPLGPVLSIYAPCTVEWRMAKLGGGGRTEETKKQRQKNKNVFPVHTTTVYMNGGNRFIHS
jgi:hypothetical protein